MSQTFRIEDAPNLGIEIAPYRFFELRREVDGVYVG